MISGEPRVEERYRWPTICGIFVLFQVVVLGPTAIALLAGWASGDVWAVPIVLALLSVGLMSLGAVGERVVRLAPDGFRGARIAGGVFSASTAAGFLAIPPTVVAFLAALLLG